MLVDLVPLRNGGVKRTDAEVQAAVPFRGELQLTTRITLNQHGDRVETSTASLLGADGERLLTSLLNARLKTVRGDEMAITGIEVIVPTGRIGGSDSRPQTWWCQLVRPGG